MAHRKAHLPQKTCPVCRRPFRWRKKWAGSWDQVTYCSERCRRQRGRQRHSDGKEADSQ